MNGGRRVTGRSGALLVRSGRGRHLWAWLLLAGTVAVGAGMALDLTDRLETSVLANPTLLPLDDEDGDGIPNVADNPYHGTHPKDPDGDADGVEDGFELAAGSDPADARSTPSGTGGARILIAPSGPDVYVVFLLASRSRFAVASAYKIIAADHRKSGTLVTSINVDAKFLQTVSRLRSRDGRVRSWTMQVRRRDVKLCSLGFGFRESGRIRYDGLVVHRRSNGALYTLRFGQDERTRLEPTEGSLNPGTGFKQCEQTSWGGNGPVRLILSEKCETRDQYICPPDCGVLAGQTVYNLRQFWLY